MKRRTQWSVALLIGGLSIAGLITASVAVSQEATPPAIDPNAILGRPDAAGAPQAIPAPGGGREPVTPTSPVGGAPGLPPASVTIPGPAATIRLEPGPGAPPSADSATGAPTPGGGGFPGMSPPADNSNIQVIGLRHANPQSVREVIETLMPAARGLVVVDTRTNLLIVRVPQQTFQEIQQLVQILDAPNPKGTGFGGSMTALDKEAAKSFTGAGAAYQVGFTANSAAELRYEYEQQDRAARELAEAIKRGAGGQALREQLRARVGQAFAARQQLLRFELAELQRRLKASQESIDLRDRVANQIVDRRVSELLDPSLQWEPSSGLLSGTDVGMKGTEPVPPKRHSDGDMFRESSNRQTPVERSRGPMGPGSGATGNQPRQVPGIGNPNGPKRTVTDLTIDPVTLPGNVAPKNPADDLFEPPRVSPTVPQPRANPAEGTGTLRGRVVFDGAFTTPPPLYQKGAAPKDTSICGAEEIPDDRILIGNGGGLANVFVYLEKAPAGTTPPLIAGPLTLDQSGCTFLPRAMIVRTEQMIHIINSDPIAHNVHTYPIKSAATNMVLAPNDMQGVVIRYSLPEKQPLAVGCDIHPWMQAYHLPLDHSFAAVTNKEGEFEINGLPAGTHRFKVWHEVGKMLERSLDVTIKPGDNDALIRVKADQLSLPSATPGGGANPKPNPGKGLPVDSNSFKPQDPAEQPSSKI